MVDDFSQSLDRLKESFLWAGRISEKSIESFERLIFVFLSIQLLRAVTHKTASLSLK